MLAQKEEYREDNSLVLITFDDAELKELNKKIKSKQLQIQLDGEKIKISKKYTLKLLEKIQSYNNQLYFWFFFSGFMSAYGFQMWYKKVQKPMDLKIANESN